MLITDQIKTFMNLDILVLSFKGGEYSIGLSLLAHSRETVDGVPDRESHILE